MKIKTKVGQSRMGQWDATVAMIRLVRELRDKLEELGEIDGDATNGINNVLCTFLSDCPQKVADEVREG